ncbi:MAG TPA: hypothetical protein VFB60_03865 [Ktedonobacteraceae bacterium]|nr:hypothetical protein [Ktedonobacteraceae bacterium]
MDVRQIKRQICSLDRGEAILLVDIETETIPQTDAHGNALYYCLQGHHVFPVKGNAIIIQEQAESTMREKELS